MSSILKQKCIIGRAMPEVILKNTHPTLNLSLSIMYFRHKRHKKEAVSKVQF